MKFFPSVVIWSLLLLCSHFPRAICSDAEDSEEYYDDVLDGVLPAILDRSDIGYFYQQGLDDLADILQFIFDRSTRTPNDDDTTDEYTVDHELSPRLTARGAGYAYTTRTKLQHDLDQALYLAKTIPDETEAAFFRKVAAPLYVKALEEIPSETADNEIHIFETLSESAQDAELDVSLIYNRAWRPTYQEATVPEKLLQSTHSIQPADNGILVFDNLLTPEALAQIQTIMAESTIWFEASMEGINGGDYVTAASLDDGLNDPLLLQLVYELQSIILKRSTDGLVLHDMWARKYSSSNSQPTKNNPTDTTDDNSETDEFQQIKYLNPGDTSSSVRIHLWLSPPPPLSNDDEDEPSGLVIYHAAPPADWDPSSAASLDSVVEDILRPSGFANSTIPHVLNRAVVYDSQLFYTRHYDDGPLLQHHDAPPAYPEKYATELTILYGPPPTEDEEDESTGSILSDPGSTTDEL